jgi:hypothetical protein
LKNIRNEALDTLMANERDTGPWTATDRYGRMLVAGSLSVSAAVADSETEGTATAGVASGVLVAANAKRIFLAIQNDSVTEKVHYSLAGTATTSHPYLNPGEYRELPATHKGAINGIRGGGSDVTVLYQELSEA